MRAPFHGKLYVGGSPLSMATIRPLSENGPGTASAFSRVKHQLGFQFGRLTPVLVPVPAFYARKGFLASVERQFGPSNLGKSIWWCEMESDLEDSSKFSGQWTDGWSIGSEANECETLGTELGQPEEVNMTLLDTEETSRVANDAKAQESSPATVRSDEEPNSSNCFVAGVTAEDLALAEFDSVEEAHARYVEYARATGFAVRKGDSGKDNEDKGYGKWKMKSFVADHNHELAPADHTNVMAPHHHMSEGDKAHVHSLHEAGFQTTQIMGFFAYLAGKIKLDLLAVVQYSYCAENHLGNLLWCNGTNHHRQTIIFGFGLLEDEKIPSYKWLLRCFLDVMRQKEPMVVVTDGDESMKEAIRSEFLNATHRLCSWHLARNAVSNIKDANFCRAFKTAVYENFVVEEFENY
ncbi:hypothetical protein AHAS_Ahas20G0254500 [Arachis hypogaea]